MTKTINQNTKKASRRQRKIEWIAITILRIIAVPILLPARICISIYNWVWDGTVFGSKDN